MSKSSVKKKWLRRLESKMGLFNAFNGKGTNPNAYTKPGSGK